MFPGFPPKRVIAEDVSVPPVVLCQPGLNLGGGRILSQKQKAPLEPDDIKDVDKKGPDEKQQNHLNTNCKQGQRI